MNRAGLPCQYEIRGEGDQRQAGITQAREGRSQIAARPENNEDRSAYSGKREEQLAHRRPFSEKGT